MGWFRTTRRNGWIRSWARRNRFCFRVLVSILVSMPVAMSNTLHRDLRVPMDIRGALRTGISRLREKQGASYTLAAELLLLHVLGRDRAWLYANPEEPKNTKGVEKFLFLI